jgi:hypothetical protein
MYALNSGHCLTLYKQHSPLGKQPVYIPRDRPTVPHHQHHKVVAMSNKVCGRANSLTLYCNKEPFLQDKSQFSLLLTTGVSRDTSVDIATCYR